VLDVWVWVRVASLYVNVTVVNPPAVVRLPAVGLPLLSHAVYLVISDAVPGVLATFCVHRFCPSNEFVLVLVTDATEEVDVRPVQRVSGGMTLTSSTKSATEA
jgi:hypothetical protein